MDFLIIKLTIALTEYKLRQGRCIVALWWLNIIV